MRFLQIAALTVAVLGGGAVRADVFKCVDDEGRVTYTNTKGGKGCTALSQDLPVSSVPSASPQKKPAPTPGAFPKVDGDTQRARDNDRRKILEEELANEQKSLEQARKELADAESDPETFRRKGGGTGRNVAAYEEKVKPLQDKVSLHERNIEALKKEIGNLR